MAVKVSAGFVSKPSNLVCMKCYCQLALPEIRFSPCQRANTVRPKVAMNHIKCPPQLQEGHSAKAQLQICGVAAVALDSQRSEQFGAASWQSFNNDSRGGDDSSQAPSRNRRLLPYTGHQVIAQNIWVNGALAWKTQWINFHLVSAIEQPRDLIQHERLG